MPWRRSARTLRPARSRKTVIVLVLGRQEGRRYGQQCDRYEIFSYRHPLRAAQLQGLRMIASELRSCRREDDHGLSSARKRLMQAWQREQVIMTDGNDTRITTSHRAGMI